MRARLAPSLLSADFARLGEAIAMIERGGAELVHLDVMDGHFVPNLSMGPGVVRAVRRVTTLPLDVHLMVSEPDRFLEAFAEAGATSMAVHVEAVPHLHRTITAIKRLGCRAGVALNPATPVGALVEIAPEVDAILVMSVDPGFGGQSFIPSSESKIQRVAELLAPLDRPIDIVIDGGVDATNIDRVVAAGATIIVAGAAIFDSPDPEAATRALAGRLGTSAAARRL